MLVSSPNRRWLGNDAAASHAVVAHSHVDNARLLPNHAYLCPRAELEIPGRQIKRDS